MIKPTTMIGGLAAGLLLTLGGCNDEEKAHLDSASTHIQHAASDLSSAATSAAARGSAAAGGAMNSASEQLKDISKEYEKRGQQGTP